MALPTAATLTPPNFARDLQEARLQFRTHVKIPVNPSSHEYNVIQEMVDGRCKIISIERIVNPGLWQQFENERKFNMLAKKSSDLKLIQDLGMDEHSLMLQ